jgi:predicted secreted protein
MRKNKGFAPIAIVLIIIAALAVGGVAYYKAKGSKTTPKIVGDSLLQKNKNSITNSAGNLKITSSDKGKTITVIKGQTITITLGNPGDGGYQFDTPQYDSSILKLTDHTHISPTSGLLGDFGKDVFEFQALSVGQTKLDITASRSFQAGSTISEFSATVVVQSITGNWIHAQEEDTGGNLVYRNSETYTPAPLRFRYYFVVKANNICGSLQLAANDGQSLKDVNCSLTTDGKTTFFNLDNEKYIVVSESDSKLVLQKVDTTTADWKTYQNDAYGFELKYPSLWAFRDGSKDWKPAGLNNFYQFCDKVITSPSGSSDSNANFVGSCVGENLKVSIWKPNTAMKIITNDFATLKLTTENKITIGGKPASELIYSGLSQISGGTHTWNLFVVSTNKFIYSINGDACMDNQAECSQIISTFKFTK